jgi:ABC-type protease/lipase transport system fused ATPase/permease subunit
VNNKRRWRRVLSLSSPYLEPGESVRRFAFAQTFNPLWNFSWVPVYVILGPFRLLLWYFIAFGAGIIVLIVLGLTVVKKTGRIVVITDRRVLVWATVGLLGRQHEFLRELPRGTMIGSASGNWWSSFNTLGERLYLVPRGWGGKNRIGDRD